MKTDTFAAECHRAEFHLAGLDDAGHHDLALHTSKPAGEAQTDKEVALAGYARVRVPRRAGEWDVDGRKVSNANLVRFPTITAGKATAQWLSLGIGGRIRRLVELAEPIRLAANRRVEFQPGEIVIVENLDGRIT